MILGCMELEGRSGHETGRLLLKKLWQENLGEDLPEIQIAPGGKPFFSVRIIRRFYFCICNRKYFLSLF